jgi:hypothetical protein
MIGVAVVVSMVVVVVSVIEGVTIAAAANNGRGIL